MSRLTEDDIALAGEYVLGLLDPAETAQVQARAATDADFAAEVEAWRERLQSMAAGADMPAPDHVWSAIEAKLPAPTGQDVTVKSLRWWRGFSLIAAATAAVFGGLYYLEVNYALRPDEPYQSGPLFVAALGSETGNAAITARYDAGNGELLLTPVSLETGKLYPELWVIPADGKARSLGMMATDKPTQVTVTIEMREFMAQGATLAITPEPAGGAPGGKATGPVIASGKIITI